MFKTFKSFNRFAPFKPLRTFEGPPSLPFITFSGLYKSGNSGSSENCRNFVSRKHHHAIHLRRFIGLTHGIGFPSKGPGPTRQGICL